MRLTSKCPICSKTLELTGSMPLGDHHLNTYKCGHIFSSKDVVIEKPLDFTSTDGEKKARPYQEQGVEFIIKSGFNCIIADQMRLGKTPQSLLALKNAYAERTPCLILVRSANLWQWIREYKTWTDSLPMGIFPIVGTKSLIFPGFSAYIMSMDTFSRPGMVDKLLAFGFKLVIVDEAHSFKNTDSNRSQALTQFIHNISQRSIGTELTLTCINCKHTWSEDVTLKINLRDSSSTRTSSHHTACPQCKTQIAQSTAQSNENLKEIKCGVVLLTGTPIKNAADEYFVPLNIVAPAAFPSLAHFQRNWLTQNDKGRYTRVKEYYMSEFKKTIAPYVLRREKEDVFTDLPVMNRIFTVIQPDKDALVSGYNKILDRMEDKLASRVNPSYWDMAEDLGALRRICGLMKVPWTSDYLEASLADSDNQRYAVGIHHKDVRDVLYYKLGAENCFKLSGEDSAERKDAIMRDFETSSRRILIINMLAGGVGMDFHYCNNVLILERQWSAADEEQFEFRFYNPDLKIAAAPTTAEYVVIKGSIEQFFYELVESKRSIFGETVSNHWSLDQDGTSFRELCEQTVGSRL